ncbi:hypothetical protein THASP1DRAFT_33487, partial [Thamnocephalis sphaerospora]
MEPRANFYKDPTLVLDFRSLYPSLMIAQNICYSTCLGHLWRRELGVISYSPPVGVLASLEDRLHVAPNGVMFVDETARKSVFAQMLHELLETRAMVKQSMKLGTDGKPGLLRLFSAREQGLKFIANVMFGYMTASYSGRMPCVELADAIVMSGRETLDKAIRTIEKDGRWPARIVYGDTD